MVELRRYLLQILDFIGGELIERINGPHPLLIFLLLGQERINNALILFQFAEVFLKEVFGGQFGRVHKVQRKVQPAHIVLWVYLEHPAFLVLVRHEDFVALDGVEAVAGEVSLHHMRELLGDRLGQQDGARVVPAQVSQSQRGGGLDIGQVVPELVLLVLRQERHVAERHCQASQQEAFGLLPEQPRGKS